MSAGKPTGEQTAGPDDPQELQREIEQTRQQLGETVEALEDRLDVKARARDATADLKARAREKAADVKDRARETATSLTRQTQEKGPKVGAVVSRQRVPIAIAVGVALLVASAVQWWRSRRA